MTESSLRPGKGLGILGGTFNPVHLGHLRAAEEIAERLDLETVVFMPAAIPPHKPGQNMAPFRHRLEMVRLAVASRPGFAVSDLESRLPPGPSYTVNTLEAFMKERPPFGELYFLVGYDSFRSIALWQRYRELFALASFAVFRRPGSGGTRQETAEVLRAALGLEPDWDSRLGAFVLGRSAKPVYYHGGTSLAISSTSLRRRLSSGSSVRFLLPEAVWDYIRRHGLYSDPAVP
jgi:nicotinate-nucleotide adenylyltransferase